MITCNCGAEVRSAGLGSRLGLCPDCATEHYRVKQREYSDTFRYNHGLGVGSSHRRALLNPIGMMVEVATLRKPTPARPKNPRYLRD